jgi:hypothetical protein
MKGDVALSTLSGIDLFHQRRLSTEVGFRAHKLKTRYTTSQQLQKEISL